VIAVVCGLLWAGVVVAAALTRPAHHARPIVGPEWFGVPVSGGAGALQAAVSGGAGALGAAPARAGSTGRQRRRRRVVAVVAAALLAAAVWPPLAIGVAAGAYLLGRWRRLRRLRAHQHAVVDALPDVVDLVGLAVAAGLTVPLLVRAMAQRAPPPFAAAFAAVVDRSEHGHRLADALGRLPERLGDPVRPLTAALVATERYGVALEAALEHLAYDARRERRRRAEMAARRLPVRLCFPLVCCILPAFGLLTIAPLLAGAFRSLRV
jgi:Flp pilus assembly protein TadB